MRNNDDGSAEHKNRSILDEAKEHISRINTSVNNKEVLTDLSYFLSPKIQKFALLRHIDLLGLFTTYTNKDFTAIERREMQKIVAEINANNSISPHKKHRTMLALKVLYRHILGEDTFYPPQVAFIKTTIKSSERKLPSDLLNEDEIEKIIQSAGSLRDKAVIALLWDTGMRIGELVNLKISSVALDGDIAHVQIIRGKTGARKVPILYSVPYLSAYIQLRQDAKHDDALFIAEGNWRYKMTPITAAGASKMLKETAARAGIKKHVHPHLLRHSRATNLACRLTEPQMRQFFGWTGGSDMPNTYVHLSGRDLDNSFMIANGKKPSEQIIVQQTEKVCLRCRKVNPATNSYCSVCGSVLDAGRLVKEDEDKKIVQKTMLEMLKDPKLKEELLKVLIIEMQREK